MMPSHRDRSPIERNRRDSVSNDCRVFVSNFPYDVKWQDVKDLFREKVGEVEHVKLYDDENGKPRGCGLVEFKTAEIAQKAIKSLDRVDWKGRKLLVKEALDGDRDKYGRIMKGHEARSVHSDKHDRQVYVSNLPYEMKWQDVKDLFREKVGNVAYVELFDDENGKPRGCGILEFDSVELARKAIDKLHRHDIKGRKILVQEALDFERDKHGYIIKKDGRRERSHDRDRDRRSRVRSRSRSRSPRRPRDFGNTYGLSPDFLESLGIDCPLHTRVFAGNLSYDVSNDKLREVFRLAGRIVSAEVVKDRDGKSKGYGVVEYAHPVEAVQAISMLNNQKLFDRPLGVRFDRDPAPEERLPRLLPEGLSGVGMGLGSDGKPLVNLLKTLDEAKINQHQPPPQQAVGLENSSVKALAELTPTLALLAQQMAQGGGLNNPLLNVAANPAQVVGNMAFSNSPQMTSASNPDFMNQRSLASSQLMAASSMGQSVMNPNSGLMGSSPVGYSRSMERLDRRDLQTINPFAPAGDTSALGSASMDADFDTIIVRNLPGDLNWKELGEFFASCGDVKDAVIKDKGIGLVRFASNRAAQRALNYDSITKWGRLLDVRPY